MSDDYKQGYRDGFKDGMEAAKNQSLLPTNYSLPPVKNAQFVELISQRL